MFSPPCGRVVSSDSGAVSTFMGGNRLMISLEKFLRNCPEQDVDLFTTS